MTDLHLTPGQDRSRAAAVARALIHRDEAAFGRASPAWSPDEWRGRLSARAGGAFFDLEQVSSAFGSVAGRVIDVPAREFDAVVKSESVVEVVDVSVHGAWADP